MNEPDVVNVGGLRKAYGSRVVVDGLHLAVQVGEIVGLVGSNSAAKTTTVECIRGFSPRSASTGLASGRPAANNAKEHGNG